MADPNGVNALAAVDGANVNARNTIDVGMEGLPEEDQKEIERELEEEIVERRWKKLACFQKIRNGVIKKFDTASASGVKVDSPLSHEDHVHMVDVSVASKYGADLTQLTHVVAEDMWNTLDAFKQDLGSNLPRQVRMLVQHINGESQGKQVEGYAGA
jgi:hypothetical protein